MTKAELKSFMQKIKVHYQEFSMEDYVITEWYKKLKAFDIDDAEKKLEQHLNGEYRKTIPRLNFIAGGLKTPEQKQNAENVRVICPHCKENIDLKKLDSHVARHNSVNYIKLREFYLNQNNDVNELMELTEVYFNKFYKKFLEELYCVIEEGEEKERIEKLIFEWSWEYL